MKVINEQRRIVAYLDGLPPIGDLRQAKVNALRGLQSHTGEELDALLPPPTGMISVLRPQEARFEVNYEDPKGFFRYRA